MQYEDILKADPTAFHQAAQQIAQFAARVRDHAVDFSTRVRTPLVDTGPGGVWDGEWTGPAGMAAGDLQLAMNKAADQLESVEPILSGHADSLNHWQQQLRQIKHDAAGAGADIHPDGTVEMKPDAAQHHGADTARKIVKAIADDISKVLQEATDGDHRAASALSKAFADSTLDAHKVGDAWRVEHNDANRAAELAKNARDDPDARAKLKALLEKHKGDSQFATELLNKLGGRGTVKLLKDVHDTTTDKALEADLGNTLAAATDPHNKDHVDLGGKWMRDFEAAGREGAGETDASGYVGVGAAMHAGGKFSSEFLNTAGSDMVAQDAKWSGEKDSEPVNGLMKALSRNPDAGRQFLNPDVKVNVNGKPQSRLDYLLDRPEQQADGTGGPVDQKRQALVLDAVGAASGGQNTGPGMHIARETINHLGATGHPPLHNDMARASMNKVMEGQLGNVNQALGQGEDGSQFDSGATSRVLGDVAHSPESYQHFKDAEKIYTQAKMDDHASDHNVPDNVRRDEIARDGRQLSSALAHLDQGRHQAIADGVANYDDRVNSMKKLSAFAVDKALDAVPGGGLAKDIAQGVSGEALDHVIQSGHDAHYSAAQQQAMDMYDNDRHASSALAEQVMWKHGITGDHDPLPAGIKPGTPLSQMTPDQLEAWTNWKQGTGYTPATQTLSSIDDAYGSAAPKDQQNPLGR